MSGLVAVVSADEYFRELVGGAINGQRLAVGSETEFYLVKLLSEFLPAERLFIETPEGNHDTEPLALMYARSLEAPREQQIGSLRKLGDVALYVSGFWSDSLSRSVVDMDYYMGMGAAAYGKVADLLRSDRRHTLYSELSTKFVQLVDCLSEVAEKTAVTSNTGVVRLYERFLQTGSMRLARTLGEQGVVAQLPPPGKLVQ